MTNRQWWIVTLGVLAVVALAAGAAAIWSGDDARHAASRPTATTTSTTVAATTTSTTSTTAAPTTTAPMVTSTVPPSTAKPSVPIPGPVAGVTTSQGGSGEIKLDWDSVSTATGYRVLRSDQATGPFSVAADVNVTTGLASAVPGVVNLWSDRATYIPAGTRVLLAAGTKQHFQYVEVVSGGVQQRYFGVVAYNAAGAGPASSVVCGSPTGFPSCR